MEATHRTGRRTGGPFCAPVRTPRQRGAGAPIGAPARAGSRWISEIVADFWSISLIGTGSTLGLVGLVSLPRGFALRPSDDNPHPMPWVRVLLSCAIGDRLYPHPRFSAPRTVTPAVARALAATGSPAVCTLPSRGARDLVQSLTRIRTPPILSPYPHLASRGSHIATEPPTGGETGDAFAETRAPHVRRDAESSALLSRGRSTSPVMSCLIAEALARRAGAAGRRAPGRPGRTPTRLSRSPSDFSLRLRRSSLPAGKSPVDTR